ncbi:hypothetical protein QUB05_02690 [Microcoleus sp. F10-C6]|uniref:hypothetical protein n=1 Tax=unclassified Microcoleus TaxID=2642155 RepID=UPI002FD018F9
MSLPRLIVGTRHCRVLTLGNINSDATGVDITGYRTVSEVSRVLAYAIPTVPTIVTSKKSL